MLDPPLDPVIAVRGLRKRYGERDVVRGVDLDVHRGEVVAILGPNGAGKTTTVEILEGFRRADGGDVRVLGEDPARASRAWRDRVGIVLQESLPPAGLTAREVLQLHAGAYSRRRPADELLELVGLGDAGDRRAAALSGGQLRRLDVALALAGDPELLFLDEPTTGFDPSARRAAWDLVDGLRQDGKTIVLTTHYLEEAERLADRIVVLRDGEVTATGSPSTLGGRDLAQGRIAFAMPDGLTVADLPAALADRVRESAGGRLVLAAEQPTADLHMLTGWALDHGVELPGLELSRPTLEDVYLDLTTA